VGTTSNYLIAFLALRRLPCFIVGPAFLSLLSETGPPHSPPRWPKPSSARPSLWAVTPALTESLRLLYRSCVVRCPERCEDGFPGGTSTTKHLADWLISSVLVAAGSLIRPGPSPLHDHGVPVLRSEPPRWPKPSSTRPSRCARPRAKQGRPAPPPDMATDPKPGMIAKMRGPISVKKHAFGARSWPSPVVKSAQRKAGRPLFPPPRNGDPALLALAPGPALRGASSGANMNAPGGGGHPVTRR
jgi:hypothetical protein